MFGHSDEEIGNECDIGGYPWSVTCNSPKNFCSMNTGNCKNNVSGTCQVKPEVCTRERRPVCGCDGITYSNACVASSSGANVEHEGECEAGNECSPMMNRCKNTREFYCKLPKGVCGNPGVKQIGECTSYLGVFCSSRYEPVCGCNNRVYSNACKARLAGVSVLKDLDATPGKHLPGQKCDNDD